MKCRTCGNEVSSEEAFCGQCGTPTAVPQALQTEMMHTPPLRTGQLHGYPSNEAFGAQNNPRGATPPIHTQGASFPPSVPMQSQPTPQSPSGQGTGFYRDATEAMSVVPSNPNAGYPQPYPTTPPSSPYPPQSTPTNYGFPQQVPLQGQPLQTGNYVGQPYSQQQPIQGGQAYRSIPTPPQKQRNGAPIFIVSICLVIALLSVVGIGTLYVLRGRNTTPKDTQTQGVASTATTVPTDVPTPTATVVPTDTVAPTPTATTLPTAAPNAGFAYCGPSCIGFTTQYPQGWSVTPLTTVQGVQFVNPTAPDQMAIFKTPGATTSSPTDLVANDLQQNFATKDNYTVLTPTTTDSVGGAPWSKGVITYQEAGQPKEYVEVYANVYQNKAYILELQASADQFVTVTTADFATIKSQFQYQ